MNFAKKPQVARLVCCDFRYCLGCWNSCNGNRNTGVILKKMYQKK